MCKFNINTGGLYRCCIKTVKEYSGPEAEGSIVPCKLCKEAMVVKDSCWHWHSDYYTKDQFFGVPKKGEMHE